MVDGFEPTAILLVRPDRCIMRSGRSSLDGRGGVPGVVGTGYGAGWVPGGLYRYPAPYLHIAWIFSLRPYLRPNEGNSEVSRIRV